MQTFVDQEVRIRLLESIATTIENRFDKLESKIDTNFHWVLGTIIILTLTMLTLFGGIILHLAKLI